MQVHEQGFHVRAGRSLRTSGITLGILFTLLVMPAALALSASAGDDYQLIDLGTLGGVRSWAADITEAGTIVGTSASPPTGAIHAFLWVDGSIDDLGTPEGFLVSTATAANDAGRVCAVTEGETQGNYAHYWEAGTWHEIGTLPGYPYSSTSDLDAEGRIVGGSYELPGASMAWLWEDGVFTELGTLGGEKSDANAINASLQIVGSSDAVPGEPFEAHAFLWQSGEITDLGVLDGETDSSARDINDLGQICGASSHTQPTYPFLTFTRACLWDGDQILDIGIDGFDTSIATGINNHRQVVGFARSRSTTRPFLWEDGVLRYLDDLIPDGTGWDLTSASAINDDGWIVGTGTAPDGYQHGYLLIPAGQSSTDPVRGPFEDGLKLLAAPNPAHARTAISYTVADAGLVEVGIFDVAGRRIATLADGFHAAGRHNREWTGGADDGRAASPGTYWVRCITKSGSFAEPIVLLR